MPWRRVLLWPVVLAALFGGCGSDGGLSREAQLFVVDADGGERRQLTDGPTSHEAPSWSPDSRHVAYVSGSCGLEVMNAHSSERRVLLRRSNKRCPTALSWSPQGALIAFAAQPQDPGPATIETVSSSGSQHRRIDRFYDERGVDSEDPPVWSPSGRRILYARFVPGEVKPGEVVADNRLKLVSVRRDGRAARAITTGAHFDSAPRWSPDGRRIAFARAERLLVVGAQGGTPRAVVGPLVFLGAPVWSPTGQQIAFSGVTVKGDRRPHVYVVDVRGGQPRRLTGEVQETPPAWSPDGIRIAYASHDGRVRTMAANGNNKRTLTTLSDAEVSGLAWSPDSRQLAFSANERPSAD